LLSRAGTGDPDRLPVSRRPVPAAARDPIYSQCEYLGRSWLREIRVKEPTSTSYAVLGLLASGSRTSYELARQVARGMRLVWPRAEGRIYDEPKLLAEHGLATSRREHTGRRPRTVYSITPKGRRALGRWVASPGAGPILEYETLLKVAFAHHGTKTDLLGHLTAIGEHATAHLAIGRTRAQEYANALVPLPDQLGVSALMWNFLWRFYSAIEDWAAWASAEVTRWPEDLSPAAETQAWAADLFRAALDTPRGQPGSADDHA
jgi:DNA-binding PadR family transcriptional regulator